MCYFALLLAAFRCEKGQENDPGSGPRSFCLALVHEQTRKKNSRINVLHCNIPAGSSI